ncbi:DUF1998 domain-containing protein [Sesbania bispinosa]|nr:DUF1998 domain-containing protein [Sesbania bispinosa]
MAVPLLNGPLNMRKSMRILILQMLHDFLTNALKTLMLISQGIAPEVKKKIIN